MKVKVTVTLDVYPAMWATEFGIDERDVRSDVQTYFAGLCTEQLASLGLGVSE